MTSVPIPRPQPVPAPVAPPAAGPPPPVSSALMVVRMSGRDELAVVHKRVYVWRHGQEPKRSPAPALLRENPVPWPEPLEGRGPSYRHQVDAAGWRLGTDLIIHGTAQSARPVSMLRLAVRTAGRTVEALAWGERRLVRRGGAWQFGEPEPFTSLVLRDEYAYGGRDPEVEVEVAVEARTRMGEEKWRRLAPALEGMLRGHQPLAYPRNQHGLGYVLKDRDQLAGRALPRLERADDRLTPERLVLSAPFAWLEQPLPMLWGGMPPYAFPRTAMMGLPPTGYEPGMDCPEIRRGLLPGTFCHGNVHSTAQADLPKLLDPAVASCADLQLRFAAGLAPRARLDFTGLDLAGVGLTTAVPGDRPLAKLPDPGGGKQLDLAMSLSELEVDTDAGTMSAIYTARHPLAQPLTPTVLAMVASGLSITERGN
jgi:hypothetical protein